MHTTACFTLSMCPASGRKACHPAACEWQVISHGTVCRFLYGPHARLQRHQGAVLGFSADARELEAYLAVAAYRLGPSAVAQLVPCLVDKELQALEQVPPRDALCM